jgi:hypothetical protein
MSIPMEKKPRYESYLVYNEFLSELEASLGPKVTNHAFLEQVLSLPAPHNVNLYVKVNTSTKVFWGINPNKIIKLENELIDWIVILVDGRAKLDHIITPNGSCHAVTIRNIWMIDRDQYKRGIVELWKIGGNDGGYKVNGNGLTGIPSFPSVAQLAKALKTIGGTFQIAR